MAPILEFEKPVVELAKKIQDMRSFASTENLEMKDELAKLEGKLEKLKKDIHGKLTPWNRVQIARHPKRPYSLDYINGLMTDFIELHGDRAYGDDAAIVAGMATFNKRPVFVIGQQKGKDVKENIKRNFGMPNPEGYRKALRVMKMAEKFDRPVLCFIDTAGAFPGIGAEERGQAEAIARNLKEMASLKVPIIVTIIGEGASGGALGIGVGDRVLMLENSWYCVISPEGCAAILWGDRAKAPELAEMMALTADKLKGMGLIDVIVPEPIEGAHRNPEGALRNVRKALAAELETLCSIPVPELVEKRIEKYFAMGVVKESV
ncbi:MAG: acetyl-CoA carboxylase carboxyltransferase subunit alpha [Fibrobacteres bacterium]|nr:acetyl-CoA carboxylase carboxyltransferase subunit alpha [Fibrobacterota bacterium]